MIKKTVALLAEGVDRNQIPNIHPLLQRVALLAEGVDRNKEGVTKMTRAELSPSSRRAWIEIFCVQNSPVVLFVALLAEGVDRNAGVTARRFTPRGRPPRGGRG